MRRSLLTLGWLLAAGLAAGAADAPASTPAAAGAPSWSLHADKQPLPAFLKSLGQLQGFPVVVDADLKGVVNGDFSNVPLEKVLNDMAGVYDFVWYNDGHTIWVSSQDKVVTRVFISDRYEVSQLLEMIQGLGLLNPTIQAKVEKNNNLLMISGPPRFLQLVDDLSQSLAKATPITLADRTSIRSFPLTYAWAYDLEFGYGQTSLKVPGVATLIAQIMSNSTVGGSSGSLSSSESQPQSMKPISAEAVAPSGLGAKPAAAPAGKSDASASASGAASTVTSQITSSVTADVRRNAVIIKDRQAAMPLYEDLIKEFDKPVRVIAITAVIVDLNSAAQTSLGLQQVSVGYAGSTGTLRPAGTGIPDNQVTASTSLVLGDLKVLANIQAQVGLGNARIVSQPAIMTFDNMGAVISQDSSFYVSVPGTFNSSLYEVTTGLALRVTPQIILENDQQKIKLLVTIRDGAVQGQGSSVQGIPQTTENFINTQAVILEGQSLLIGGIYRSTEKASETGVPWLKDVPVLGYLFKTSTTEHSQVERAYLITPRIVELNAANQNAQDFKLLIPTAEPDPVLTPKPFYSIPKYPPGPNAAPGASSAPVPMPHIFKP